MIARRKPQAVGAGLAAAGLCLAAAATLVSDASEPGEAKLGAPSLVVLPAAQSSPAAIAAVPGPAATPAPATAPASPVHVPGEDPYAG